MITNVLPPFYGSQCNYGYSNKNFTVKLLKSWLNIELISSFYVTSLYVFSLSTAKF